MYTSILSKLKQSSKEYKRPKQDSILKVESKFWFETQILHMNVLENV